MSWNALGILFLSPVIALLLIALLAAVAHFCTWVVSTIRGAIQGNEDDLSTVFAAIMLISTLIGLWCLGWLK